MTLKKSYFLKKTVGDQEDLLEIAIFIGIKPVISVCTKKEVITVFGGKKSVEIDCRIISIPVLVF